MQILKKSYILPTIDYNNASKNTKSLKNLKCNTEPNASNNDLMKNIQLKKVNSNFNIKTKNMVYKQTSCTFSIENDSYLPNVAYTHAELYHRTSNSSTRLKIKNKKQIKYSTGLKYLLEKDDSLYIKNQRIKNSVNKNLNMENVSTKITYNNENLDISKFDPDDIIKNNLNKKITVPKLYIPCSGMNNLRRFHELEKEEPYLFINNFYRNEDIKQNKVLLELFNDNNKKINKYLQLNNNK